MHFVIIFLKALQTRKLVCAAHMSYMLSLQNMYLFRDILRYFKKGTFAIVKMNVGDSSSCRMSLDPKPLEASNIIIVLCLWKGLIIYCTLRDGEWVILTVDLTGMVSNFNGSSASLRVSRKTISHMPASSPLLIAPYPKPTFHILLTLGCAMWINDKRIPIIPIWPKSLDIDTCNGDAGVQL